MRYELNGISTPVGGVSWSKTATGRELFVRLFLFLESKRILVNPIEMENKEWCIESVLEIKTTLVSLTQGVSLKDYELHILRSLIDACNQFLNTVSPLELPSIIYKSGDNWENLSFDRAMKQLRNSFRQEIEKVEKKYKLCFAKDIPEEY